jgi:hypothetical protein
MSISIGSIGGTLGNYGISSLVSDPTGVFKKMDANGDGKVDKTELTNYLQQASAQSGAMPSADQLLDQIDVNGDGSISQDEYTAFAQMRSQELQAVSTAEQTIANAQLSMLKSAVSSSASSSTATSDLINLYAQNLNAADSQIVSSLNVKA